MNEELIKKAMQMFDTPEKWNAFRVLVESNIVDRWWKKLQTEVYQRELRAGDPDWDIRVWTNWDIKWFPKKDPENALMIHFCGDTFNLPFNFGYLDTNKVNKLIEDHRFNVIKTCFDRYDGSDSNQIGWETRNFSFGTTSEFRTAMNLCWYAGNETEEFANQIIKKVRKFQTPEVTELFREINRECKKDNQ